MIENLFRPMHILVILAIAVLIFGPKRFPEVGKALGEGLRHLRDAINTSNERRG